MILDGKRVSPEEINPSKHRFIGVFRPPVVPDTKYTDPKTGEIKYADVLSCPCGQMLWYKESVFQHYIQGHFDEPQYVTIEPEGKKIVCPN